MLPLSDVFNPCAEAQPENQSFVQRVCKVPEIYEMLRFFQRCFYVSLVLCYFDKVGSNLHGGLFGKSIVSEICISTNQLIFSFI